jgi:hypothetical protein
MLIERERERDTGYHRSRSSPAYHDLDLDEQEVYSFTLSRHRKSLFTRDSTGGSLSDISEKELVVSAGSIPQPGKYCHVLRSKYTGEGSLGGFQSATLKVSGETNQGSRRSPQTVFRWV